MDTRIAPPRDFEEMLDKLTGPPNVFETKQKALMFAAALGNHLGRSTPIDRRGTAIRFDIFERALDDGFIDALAVAERGSLSVLSDENAEERVRIFEEYAHTGLIEMRRVCYEEAGDPLHNLIRLADNARAQESASVPGIDPAVLRELMG